MEVDLTPDKEARVHELAERAGKNTNEVLNEAVDRLLEYNARFMEAVEQGRASASRGDLIDHNDVVERIDRMLRS